LPFLAFLPRPLRDCDTLFGTAVDSNFFWRQCGQLKRANLQRPTQQRFDQDTRHRAAIPGLAYLRFDELYIIDEAAAVARSEDLIGC